MRVLNRLDVTGSFGLGSSVQDQFVIGSPDLENNDISADNLKVWANADFKNNVTLGSNNSDIIAISGTLINQGGASLTGSFSGSGQYLNNIPNGALQNYEINLNGSNIALGATASVGTLKEITSGPNITVGLVNATTRSVSLNDNINLSSVSASFSGSGALINNLTASNINNFPADIRKQISGTGVISYDPITGIISYTGAGGTIYTAGNITGSGTSGDAIGITPNPTFTSVTSSYFTGSTANLDYIDFTDQTTDPPQLNGTLWHRTDSDYNELRMWTEVPDVHIKIGQQVVVRVHNGTGAAIAKGSVVHLTGAISPAVPRIAKADWANDYLSANTLGVLNSTLNNGDEGYVVISGLIEGVDTSAFAEGDVLYLSGSGGFSNVKAVAPNHLVIVGQVIRQGNSSVGSIFVKVQNGYEIEELHDVLVTSPQNYDLLVRDTDGLWKNTKNLSGSYTLNSITSSNGFYTSGSDNTSIFDVSSSIAGVRVTQRGTGAAIVVEDSANPDSSVFMVAANGAVAIGYGTGSSLPGGYELAVNGDGYFVGSVSATNLLQGYNGVVVSNQSTGYVTASFIRGNQFTASVGISGRLYDTASYALDSDKLDGYDSSDFAKLGSINTFSAANNIFNNDVTINGTASIAQLNTINQTSLVVGDKYITILSGSSTHVEMDGAGILFGSGSSDITSGEQTSVAHIIYRMNNPLDLNSDYIEVYPQLRSAGVVSGSNLTGSNTGDETQTTIKTKLGAATTSVDGYLTSADWTTFNNKQNAITLTTNGTSGSATFDGTTLNVPRYVPFIPPLSPSEIARGYTFVNNSVNITTTNLVTPSSVDLAPVAVTVASTNALTRQTRAEYRGSSAATNQATGIYTGADAKLYTVSGSGFRFVAGFGASETSSVPDAGMFIGLTTSSINPETLNAWAYDTHGISTAKNMIGIGCDGGDANLSIMHNDATGNATKINLGSAFVANKSGSFTDFFQVEIYNPVNSSNVYYRAFSIENNTEVTGTITTDLPSSSTALGIIAFRTSGGSSVAVRLCLSQVKVYSQI